ncbi:uncharacterized protein LOC131906523 [Peromyscus eremicus]|uniref:uncharacterized protein LOC131906523 n=1 Tax=Peromyscus eremicus TaxID=42410 RepID=UPI0027DDA8DA|nr:uncharacterized protein LOC131906523 [Peromyscus eremicus]
MSEEKVTYTTVRFHKSSVLQNGGRSDETQGSREAGHRKCSVPWHLIAIPLGILCSTLLVIGAVLVKHVFQYSQEKHELQKTLNNLHQEYITMQNESYLREEMLRNKSKEYDALKDHLNSLNRKENRRHGETNLVPDCIQITGTNVEGHWFCYGVKCYFIMDNKHWSGCSQTCQGCSLSLLKIDDYSELTFLISRLTKNSYWIGLKYDKRSQKWQCIGDGPSKVNLTTMKSLKESGVCAFLSFGGILRDDCGRTHPCFCEKRIDKFSDSVCSIKEENHSRADFNSDRTSLTPKMSDEEITYTTVRFHKSSSELQNKGRPDETQGSREAGHRKWSVPWHLIAIPLGILCSILLVIVAVLVKNIFQYTQEKHELQKALNNLHKEYSTMQNASYLMEEMWKNKSIECVACKDHLASLNRKQNRCYGDVVLDCKQLTGRRVEGHWFCTGIKCYYFIMDNKRWSGCKQTCQNCSLSLLNIEDNDELKFLQLQIKPYSYWIGLSYNTTESKWQWIGDGPSKLAYLHSGDISGSRIYYPNSGSSIKYHAAVFFSLQLCSQACRQQLKKLLYTSACESLRESTMVSDLNTVKLNHNTGRCAFLSRTRLDNDNCHKTYTCICEKRLDKLPDSLFSRS